MVSVLPMYRVFIGFTKLTRPAEVRFADSRASLQHTDLAWVTLARCSDFWLANLTASSASILNLARHRLARLEMEP